MGLQVSQASPSSLPRRVLRVLGFPVRALLLAILWGYQHLVSPLLGPRCRYYPSCSNYAVEAIRTHGAGKGTLLAIGRVGRCHPWAAGGVNPVPPKGSWRAVDESDFPLGDNDVADGHRSVQAPQPRSIQPAVTSESVL